MSGGVPASRPGTEAGVGGVAVPTIICLTTHPSATDQGAEGAGDARKERGGRRGCRSTINSSRRRGAPVSLRQGQLRGRQTGRDLAMRFCSVVHGSLPPALKPYVIGGSKDRGPLTPSPITVDVEVTFVPETLLRPTCAPCRPPAASSPPTSHGRAKRTRFAPIEVSLLLGRHPLGALLLPLWACRQRQTILLIRYAVASARRGARVLYICPGKRGFESSRAVSLVAGDSPAAAAALARVSIRYLPTAEDLRMYMASVHMQSGPDAAAFRWLGGSATPRRPAADRSVADGDSSSDPPSDPPSGSPSDPQRDVAPDVIIVDAIDAYCAARPENAPAPERLIRTLALLTDAARGREARRSCLLAAPRERRGDGAGLDRGLGGPLRVGRGNGRGAVSRVDDGADDDARERGRGRREARALTQPQPLLDGPSHASPPDPTM